MPSGNREVVASTVFVPVAGPGPVLSAYRRNCSLPAKIAPGHYQVVIPEDIDPLTTSITARGAGALPAPGSVRDVTVVITRHLPIATSTTVDIYVRDNLGAASDEAYEIEATLAQLPLGT